MADQPFAVRTASRISKRVDLLGEPVELEIPTVEIVVDGIIFRTDCLNKEQAMHIALRTAYALLGGKVKP